MTLLGLSGSCAGRSQIVNEPAVPCRVAAWPSAPAWDQNDEAVWLTNVGLWVRAVERIHDDLKACPNIVWVP